MTRRLLATLVLVSLQALSAAAPLAIAHASPGIRTLDEDEVARLTDLRARVRVVAVERTERDGTVEVRSVVRVLSVSGRAASALRTGALVTFRTWCHTRPVRIEMSGYPNSSCSSTWWQMPHGLTQRGRIADLPLVVGRDDAGRVASFSVVVGTWPAVGHAFGELGDRRLHRVASR